MDKDKDWWRNIQTKTKASQRYKQSKKEQALIKISSKKTKRGDTNLRICKPQNIKFRGDLVNFTTNIKQSFLIKKFFIYRDLRKQKASERNLNWGYKGLPKVEWNQDISQIYGNIIFLTLLESFYSLHQ